MKPPRVPEKVVQAHVVLLLKSIGAEVWVLGTRRPKGDHMGTRQTSGLPDVCAFLPVLLLGGNIASYGTQLWIEVKAAGGRASAAQLAFEQACRRTNTPYLRGDLDALIGWLTTAGYLTPGAMRQRETA
jgi:hypothetical protein